MCVLDFSWCYLKDVQTQLAHAHADAGGNTAAIPVDLLASLLPDAWSKSHPDLLHTFREVS